MTCPCRTQGSAASQLTTPLGPVSDETATLFLVPLVLVGVLYLLGRA